MYYSLNKAILGFAAFSLPTVIGVDQILQGKFKNGLIIGTAGIAAGYFLRAPKLWEATAVHCGISLCTRGIADLYKNPKKGALELAGAAAGALAYFNSEFHPLAIAKLPLFKSTVFTAAICAQSILAVSGLRDIGNRKITQGALKILVGALAIHEAMSYL